MLSTMSGTLTVQNRSLEVTEEFEKHVFLFGGELVESRLFPSLFDRVIRKTLLDVCVQPLLWNLVEFASTATCS